MPLQILSGASLAASTVDVHGASSQIIVSHSHAGRKQNTSQHNPRFGSVGKDDVPSELFDELESERSIGLAEEVLKFVSDRISEAQQL